MTRAVQRKVLAAVAAALLGIGCRDSTTVRPVADLSAGGVRVTGTGQIQDAASPPSWWDEFNFDVRSDLTGKLVYNEHWYRPDGSYVVLVVDASDPETGITAFQSSSSACSDPTKGAEFDGVSRERSEEHTSELQSRLHLVCRLLLEKKKKSSNKIHGGHGEA